ncbi:MAG: hypothetical protein KC621_05690 [Myxococcales bacterium]|nr:hypothetical protein [Myxococcales bacterium]
MPSDLHPFAISARKEARSLYTSEQLRASYPEGAPRAFKVLWDTLQQWADPSHVDQARRDQDNRCLLIHGDRGAGKTTLLHTLLAAGRVHGGNIVFTDIVHFQTLDDEVAVIPMLVQPLRGLARSANEPRCAAWHPPASLEEKWERLARSLVERSGTHGESTLEDPALAAHLITEAQECALALETNFEAWVDELCKSWPVRDPLFVVSIDDGDLLPGPLAALLRGLRVLYHPRVVWLLTGQPELLHTILMNDVARQVLGDRGRASELPPVARALAQKMLQRVIPPHHRVEVRPADPREPDGALKDLFDAMDACSIQRSTRPTLLDLFLCYAHHTQRLLLPEDQRSRLDLAAVFRTEGLLGGLRWWWEHTCSHLDDARRRSIDALVTFDPADPVWLRTSALDWRREDNDGAIGTTDVYPTRSGPLTVLRSPRLTCDVSNDRRFVGDASIWLDVATSTHLRLLLDVLALQTLEAGEDVHVQLLGSEAWKAFVPMEAGKDGPSVTPQVRCSAALEFAWRCLRPQEESTRGRVTYTQVKKAWGALWSSDRVPKELGPLGSDVGQQDWDRFLFLRGRASSGLEAAPEEADPGFSGSTSAE